MAEYDPITQDLAGKYQPLIGKEFRGTYQGLFTMPQTGNVRDVLVVDKQDPFAATLREISTAVLLKYGSKRIWKGITGPEDSNRYKYADYWLWVEPGFCEELQEGFTYEFKIDLCHVFVCGGGSFSYGINIRVSATSEAGVNNAGSTMSH